MWRSWHPFKEVKFLITHFKCSKVIFEAIFYNQYRSYSDDVHIMKTRPVNSNNNCDWWEKMQHTMLHEYLFFFYKHLCKNCSVCKGKTSYSCDTLMKQVRNWFSNLAKVFAYRFQDTEAELNPCPCNKWWSIFYQYSSQRCKEFNSYV